jgi:hypothetical protein
VRNISRQISRRACGSFVAATVFLGTAAPARALVTINFDDQPGMPPPFEEGRPVPAQFLIDDEYAAFGVLFTSAGGGIARSAPSNAVSPPNTAAATGPGPVLSYSHPVFATFQLGDTPAVADHVSLALTNSSQPSALDAFDVNGALLGTAMGGASATLSLTFEDRIHSIRIRQGPMAFDNFTFDGLQAVPEPGACTAALGAVLAMLMGRRWR